MTNAARLARSASHRELSPSDPLYAPPPVCRSLSLSFSLPLPRPCQDPDNDPSNFDEEPATAHVVTLAAERGHCKIAAMLLSPPPHIEARPRRRRPLLCHLVSAAAADGDDEADARVHCSACVLGVCAGCAACLLGCNDCDSAAAPPPLLVSDSVRLANNFRQATRQLHQAASTGDSARLRVLLALAPPPGVRVDYLDRRRRTPLHVAAYGGHGACIALLVGAGAAFNATDDVRHRGWQHAPILLLFVSPYVNKTLSDC